MLLCSLVLASWSRAADVEFHVVAAKGQWLMQTNAAGPLIAPTNDPPYVFMSVVELTAPGTVTNVVLQTPLATFPLAYDAGDALFSTNAGFASKANLDAAFPNGVYTQTIYAIHDGTRRARLTLAPDSYPNDPFITNWAAAQAVEITNSFTLYWSLSGGGLLDYLNLEIEDPNGNEVASTPAPGEPGALTGTNTFFTFPAGTFAPGTNYEATLLFARIIGMTNAFPGVPGVCGFLKQNRFSIRTAPQPNLVFFDGFQLFQGGENLTGTNYTPVVGYNARFELQSGSASATATNVRGDVWAWIACPAYSALSYLTAPSRVLSNEIVQINWLMRISQTNNGDGGVAVQILSITEHSQPLLWFADTGVVVAFTNNPAIGPAVPIGSWGHLVGTVMTNQLVIDYANRWFSYALNGTTLTNMPLCSFYANRFDRLNIAQYENGSSQNYYDNQLALNNLQITFEPAAPPPDVTHYLAVKSLLFAQTNASAPVSVAGNSCSALLEVGEPSSGTVVSASVQLPGGSTRTLFEEPDASNFKTKEWFSNTNNLNAVYGNGLYSFIIVGAHDGTRTATVNFASTSFPNAPQVLNWSAAQAIDPNSDFVLTWNNFVGGTPNDFIQLEIYANNGLDVFCTPGFGEPGALNGTNTSVTIPAHTLGLGTNYTAILTFAKLISLNTNDYPGAVGVAACVVDTEFDLHTAGPDSVGDGIADWWRALYFGSGTTTNAQSAAFADPDGDGLSNLQEYLANTNPTNSASAFRILSVTRTGTNETTITWSSVGGGRYRVQYSDGDERGGFNGQFTDLVRSAQFEIDGAPTGTASTQSFTDDYTLTGPPARTNRFYRIKLVR